MLKPLVKQKWVCLSVVPSRGMHCPFSESQSNWWTHRSTALKMAAGRGQVTSNYGDGRDTEVMWRTL